MHWPLINYFTATWFLLSLIDPLQSNPQVLYNLPYVSHQMTNRYQSPNLIKPLYVQNVQKPTSHENVYTYPREANADSWLHSKLKESLDHEDYRKYDIQPDQKNYFEYDDTKYENFEPEDSETEGTSDDVIEKMNYLAKIFPDDSSENDVETKNSIEERINLNIPEETRRVVRQVKKQRPGFFWTLARVTFETFNDTRSAIKQISEIINNNFAPDTTTQKPVTSNSLMDQNKLPSNVETVNDTTTASPTTTTEAPYKFTATGVQNLIRRNIKGLIRLFNIEWQDALNESEKSVRQFQQDLSKQIGEQLRDNPRAS